MTAPPRLSVATVPLALTLVASGCAARQEATPARDGAPPVLRHFLSGEANDWEPSLAVGHDGTVHVIAMRHPPSPPGVPPPPGDARIVSWSSTDRGATWLPATTFGQTGGDGWLEVARDGTMLASWIRVVMDSTGRRPDTGRGGLVLATSRDLGRSWSTSLAAPMASGVADKPVLAASPDGRDLYIAFMGPGSLDVVASHDAGATWERHTADTTRTAYWPTSIALAPDGTLWLTDARRAGSPGDTVLRVDTQLLRSTDRGATWDERIVSRSTRLARVDDCVHGDACPVQIPYSWVAVDARNRVYLVTTEGEARWPFELRFSRSADSGATWPPTRVLSAAPRPSSGDGADHFYPMVAAAGDGLVYVTWFDDRAGPVELWARRSADGGRTWGPDVRLSPPGGMDGIFGEYGGIGIDGRGALHVTWADGVGHVSRTGGRGGVWYARWDGRVPEGGGG